MTAYLDLSDHDTSWMFAELPDIERRKVRMWIDAINEFEVGDDKRAAIASMAARYPLLAISHGSIYRKREAFARSGWQGLVPAAKLRRVKASALPEAFIDFWQVLCEQNQRKIKPAYRSLFLDHLCAGKTIPGYGDWRRIWATEHPKWAIPEFCPYRPHDATPARWSYRNLLRYAPDEFALAAARIGLGEATKFLPKVPTTRAGLHLGQFFVIDDVWHDVKVNFLGNRNAHLPLELGALELLSGHYCVYGLKPIVEREDGSRQMLPERYLRYLLAHILCRIGIHPEGCTFLGEHGTARISADLLDAINRWAGGKVAFEAGGVHGAPIAKGLYAGRPRGNSRFKAALESHHNLKHNELAQLPGQKGMDRDHAPEELYGRDKENRALVKAVHALAEERPELAEQLRLPFCSFAQFSEMLAIVYDRIADRIHHDLEGFEEAGLVLQEFRLAAGLPWMPMSVLRDYDAAQRAAIEAVISRPGMVQLRPMSPRQAFDARRHELVRLPDCALPDILGHDLAAEATVSKDLSLDIPDLDIPNRRHMFAALVRDAMGRERALPRGEKYRVHVSPFGDDRAYISDMRGAFLGIAPALQRACRTDTEAIERNLGIQRHALSAELRRLAPLGEQRLRDRYEDTRHNVRVLTGSDPEEIEARAMAEAADAAQRARFIPEPLTDAVDDGEEEADPRLFSARSLL